MAALYQGVGGRGIDPRNVLQMNGGHQGANLAVLYTLVNPGDHVVAEYPTYQPLYEIPRALGRRWTYGAFTRRTAGSRASKSWSAWSTGIPS